MTRICVVIAFGALALAQDNPPAPVKPVSAELRAKFWRARAEVVEAEHRAAQARIANEAAVNELRKACGQDELIIGQNGEPACAPKQAAKE